MSDLIELIRGYGELLKQERWIDERKQAIRQEIAACLASDGLKAAKTPFGTAKLASRFKLSAKREAVLGLLEAADLFEFASFSSARVKDVLVPKYGREKLLPLFEIERTEYLMVTGAGRPSTSNENPG